MKTRFVPVILTAAITSLITLFVAGKFFNHNIEPAEVTRQANQMPVNYANYSGNVTASTPPADFQPAAEASVQAVVHVKTKTKAKEVVFKRQSFWGDFYEKGFMPPQMGAGSGVVVSPEGYIVTNNHVVADADIVTVTFNDRFTTDAKLVATDPSTDLAVLKIEEKNLPYMEFGNSDDVNLGQWVLAVGYPLTLDATVTAGIISAKGRSLGINRRQSTAPVEAFLQTDAAVNPGNSGGALVNTDGQLIGINSAIASPTGSYAGYSYAIPSNIVKKVVDDLIQYGAVQRGFLGISYLDKKLVSEEKLSQLGLDRNDGIYVASTLDDGAAKKAGINQGDIITEINGVPVNTAPQLQEQLARYKPGDNISITYSRNGNVKRTTAQLTNIDGTTQVVKETESGRFMGASFKTVSNDEKRQYGIDGGVKVTDVGKGLLSEQTSMKNGFIITKVNDRDVTGVQELQSLIAANNYKVRLAGVYPGKNGMYYYGIKPMGEMNTNER